MIRLVAFDLGGVLVDVSFKRAAEALGISDAIFRQRVFGDGGDALHRAMALGSAPKTFLRNIAKQFETEEDLAERAWGSVVRPFPGAGGLVDAVDTFMGDGTVCAWSNIDLVHTARLYPAFPTLLAQRRALSYEMRTAKPQEAFFDAALHRSGVAAEEVLFLDDSDENVQSARALGIDAHVAKGLAGVREVLQSTLGFELPSSSDHTDLVEST